MPIRSLSKSFFLAAAVLLATAVSFAQEITGSMSGLVQDASGAVVPNAKVSVKNVDRDAVIRTVVSDKNGAWSAPLLPIGEYSAIAEASGFKKVTKTGIKLNVNDRLTINFALEVGQTTDTITVQDVAPQVELQTSTQQNLVSGAQIRELSLNNRNYQQLLTLIPGVSSGASDQIYIGLSNPSGQTNTVNFAVNGTRASSNNWNVDGADNVDRGSNLTVLNYPSVDSIAEFRVLRGQYSAEFGRGSGGQVNVITKSGTSSLHGSAYEFVRNDAFAANNTFNNANSVNLGRDGKANVPPLRYNNFGYTIGGPIYIPKIYEQRNKTFFFFSEEFRRVITYGTSIATLPTANEKKGIFTQPVCIQSSGNTCTQTATQINNINPVAQAYITDIFSKIPDGAAGTGQVVVPLRNVFNARQELYKVDHTFSEKLSISGRFLNDSIPTVEPGGLFTNSPVPGAATTATNAPGRNFVFRATSAFTPHLLNEGGYAFSQGRIISDITGLVSSKNSPSIAGQTKLPFTSTLDRVPSLTFTGGSSITSFGPYDELNRNHNFFDNLTLILGRHNIKFGGQVNLYTKTENAGGNNAGTFGFVNTPRPTGTGNFQQSWANFLLGNVSNFSQTSLDLTPRLKANQAEFFVQDDYRVKSNLTINLGLRYSLFRQPYDQNNQLTNFDPASYSAAKAPQIDPKTGNLVAGTGDPLNGIVLNGGRFGSKASNENYLNFAPRIGFAWDPFRKGRTSIRAGYGIYYDTILTGIFEQAIFNNPPYVNNVNIPNTSFANPAGGTAATSLIPRALRGTPSNYQTPYNQQWSLDIQHQIIKDLVATVGYVGSKGTHLPGIVDLNQPQVGAAIAAGIVPAGTVFTAANVQLLNSVRPYRGYTAINTVQNEFNSNYNSLQVSLEKRFSAGSLFSLAYTYAKNLTDNQSDRSTAPQNNNNRRGGEYGLAQFDRRHSLVISYVYELPFFKGTKGLTKQALAGWQISGISTFSSGLPLTVTSGLGTDPGGLGTVLSASVASPRPDAICDPNKNAPHTRLQYFNTSCFADVPAGQVRPGNAGRGIVNGPGLQRWDFSIFKTLSYKEAFRVQLRGEAFNVFNHANPFTVNTSLGNVQFGRVTAYRDPRLIQIGAKLYF